MTFTCPENARLTWANAARLTGHDPRADHGFASLMTDPLSGPNGAFYVRGPLGEHLLCIASNEKDWEAAGLPLPAWEHVSVSTRIRTPTWREMCFIKDLFWSAEDCVVQFHPPQSAYVNCHPYCLHLWRPIGVDIPRPPIETVG